MEVALTQETSLGLGRYSQLVQQLSNQLRQEFTTRNYGPGLEQIIVNLVCVAPEFAAFFKKRNSTYRPGSSVLTVAGVRVEVRNSISLDVLLQPYLVKDQELAPMQRYVVERILEAIHTVEKREIGPFDWLTFEQDLRSFLLRVTN